MTPNVGGCPDHFRQHHALAFQSDGAARDPRDVEKIPDQTVEMLGLPANDLSPTLDERWIAPAQKLDGVNDRSERIAQFMSEHGQEFVFAPIGLRHLLCPLLCALLRLPVLRSDGPQQQTSGGSHPPENLKANKARIRAGSR